MSQQNFRNIVYCSDVSGTAKWRRIWPMQSIDCISEKANILNTYTQTPILDQNYYKGITSVTIQRWIADQQLSIVQRFLKPICDANSAWLIYEIDDNMSDKHIPLFNRGRKAFEGKHVQNNIKEMLNAADFVTVTTDYIKEFYHKEYGVPLDNILAIPNLLPRYLFDDYYNVNKKIEQFKQYKNKPRIGIVSSLSHYNVDNTRVDNDGLAVRQQQQNGQIVWVNEENKIIPEELTHVITDDLDEIIDCIRSTVNDFQWVFFGFCPPKLNDLVQAKKIEVHSGKPIMNYASTFNSLNLQAVIAPIKDMEFNRCKSFIKYMEAAALGIPLFASNSLPYSRIMPTEQLFSTSNELKQKLIKLKFMSAGAYQKIIEAQWKWLNTPCHEGSFNINNYWLEDNINLWVDLFRLRQKTLTISLNSFYSQYTAQLEQEKKNLIYSNDNGVVITK